LLTVSHLQLQTVVTLLQALRPESIKQNEETFNFLKTGRELEIEYIYQYSNLDFALCRTLYSTFYFYYYRI
jgi:hypothetical protein